METLSLYELYVAVELLNDDNGECFQNILSMWLVIPDKLENKPLSSEYGRWTMQMIMADAIDLPVDETSSTIMVSSTYNPTIPVVGENPYSQYLHNVQHIAINIYGLKTPIYVDKQVYFLFELPKYEDDEEDAIL